MKSEIKGSELLLIDAIEVQPETKVIFKAHGRLGVPHKILQVNRPCCCLQNQFSSIAKPVQLSAGDYVAAYRTPQTTSFSGAYHVVKLTPTELEEIDTILKKRFNTSLQKEQSSNSPVSLRDLSSFTVRQSDYQILISKSAEKYKAGERNTSGLHSIIRLNGSVKLWACNGSLVQKDHFYYAQKGEYFAIRFEKKSDKTVVHLYPISRTEALKLKVQDKKEKILIKYEQNKGLLGRYIIAKVKERTCS